MYLKRQMTPDNRLMTATLNSLKIRFGSQRLNFNNGSMVNESYGTECNHYEQLVTKTPDDQESYETLNNQLTPHVNVLVTSEIKSIETRLATISAIKRLNYHRAHIENNYENVPVYKFSRFDDEYLKIKSIENRLGTPSAIKRSNDYENWNDDSFDFRRRLVDTYSTPTDESNDYEHFSENIFDNERHYTKLNYRLKDGYLTPTAQSLNTQDSTPTGSIFSHSYCEIDTPIRNNKLNFTIDANDQLSPIEYGSLLFPRQPIRGRHGNKRGKITYLASSVERKPKTGLFSRAKKDKSAKTSLTQTSQMEEQRSDEKKSSQVNPSFKSGKFRSSLSKLKSQITQTNQSTENHETSPCISPIKTRVNLRNESLFQSSEKSSQGKGFLSKCRNRLQSLTMKAN